MNQARIWTVVKPTVGLPLFLGAVATTALLVHYAILTHTTWFAGYWNGHAHAAPATASAPAAAAPASSTP